ncbi:MAG: PEGA domain-containing protein, partial [Treponema sp.]|nr:PEGA domain-containing protein [Treponema sp.]
MKTARAAPLLSSLLLAAFFLAAHFLIFLILPLRAAADEYNESAGSGLFIGSVPSGAKVFIDGVERGTTPYGIPSIRTGEYAVRVSKEGYVDRRFKIVVRRDSRVEVTVDLEEASGQVLLKLRRDPPEASLPFEPRINADGRRVYESAGGDLALSLPVGWRNITVEAFGWEKAGKSVYVEEGTVQTLELVLKPAAFALSGAALRNKRINPQSAALGEAELRFEVSGPGRGLLEALDSAGRVVFSRNLGPFTAWQQRTVWDGRDSSGVPAADGLYTLRLSVWEEGSAGDRTGTGAEFSGTNRVELSLALDGSLEVRPLSTAALSPGLFFAPSPETLPPLSYQIEGMLLGGKPLLRSAWETLPFAAGIRVSPLDRLEAAAAFNAAPHFSGGAEWGAGASVKWVFLKPGVLGAAAEIAYGWAGGNPGAGPYSSFGMGTGLALRLPLSYRPLSGDGAAGEAGDALRGFAGRPWSLDLLASPLFLWAGGRGRPDGVVPRLGLEGGALFSYGGIAAGLSLRWDYAPVSEDASLEGSGPLQAALEIKFMPS